MAKTKEVKARATESVRKSFNLREQGVFYGFNLIEIDMNTDIIALFVCLDDFCKIYNSSIKEKMLPVGRKRNREGY